MKPYELVIDHEACWGCRTCEVACKQEFNTSSGVHLIYVSEHTQVDETDRKHFNFRVNVCIHCDDPPCLEVCPEEAIFTRDDGIVILDEEACTGCQLCMDACPYAAISFDGTIAHKCNLCSARIDHGLVPACADNVCLAHCIYFGAPEEVEQQRKKRLGFS